MVFLEAPGGGRFAVWPAAWLRLQMSSTSVSICISISIHSYISPSMWFWVYA